MLLHNTFQTFVICWVMLLPLPCVRTAILLKSLAWSSFLYPKKTSRFSFYLGYGYTLCIYNSGSILRRQPIFMHPNIGILSLYFMLIVGCSSLFHMSHSRVQANSQPLSWLCPGLYHSHGRKENIRTNYAKILMSSIGQRVNMLTSSWPS
jgi:hypothetical protein